jgi:N-acetylglucosaminyldiphosphoundecaprenol N-acetyl-beta-D-mannosaminyltransferase
MINHLLRSPWLKAGASRDLPSHFPPPFEDLDTARRDIGGGLMLSLNTPHEIVQRVASLYPRNTRPIALLAAHITSLNACGDSNFRDSFNAASATYVDGISVKLLAKSAGHPVEKLATTDLAPALIKAMTERVGRRLRVAVIGGEEGIAKRAGERLSHDLGVETVFVAHGYQADWRSCLARLAAFSPDVVIVGLGMPLEAVWCRAHAHELPKSVVLTCGGWLRILAREENRSPVLVQRFQLEWLFRLVTDPRRTARRYIHGIATLAMLCSRAALRRALD